jgi:hypothetical protein
MKWFFGVVVLLNLAVALWGTLKTHPASDIHAQEISPHSIRLLPADWKEGTLAPSTDASAAIAKPAVEPTKLVANLDPSNASALLAQPQPAAKPDAKPAAKVEAKPEPKPEAKPEVKTATAPKPEVKPAAAPKPESKPVVAAKPDTTVAAAAKACYEWGELDGKTLGRVKPELAVLKLKADEHPGQGGHGGKFWVYYPAAQKDKSADLIAKGFNNYPVHNEGEYKDTLSLGLFVKEEGARELMQRLKAAGFDAVQMIQRGSGTRTLLSFKQLDTQQDEALHKLQQRMAPGVPLKHLTCS